MTNGTFTSLAQSQGKHFGAGVGVNNSCTFSKFLILTEEKKHKREDNIRSVPRKRSGADVNKRNK